MNPALKDIQRELSALKKRRKEADNIFFSYAHLARKMGWTLVQTLRLRDRWGDFPKPPCSRMSVENWIRVHLYVPGLPGSRPDMLEHLQIYLLLLEGYSYLQVAKLLGLQTRKVKRVWRSVRKRLGRCESQIWSGPLLTAARTANSMLNIPLAWRMSRSGNVTSSQLDSLTSKPATSKPTSESC